MSGFLRKKPNIMNKKFKQLYYALFLFNYNLKRLSLLR